MWLAMQELQSKSANFPFTTKRLRSARAIKLRKGPGLRYRVLPAAWPAPAKFQETKPRVEESRRDRPQDPEGDPGRWPNHQCRARQACRDFTAALPAPGQDPGGGGLYPGLSRAAGSPQARLRRH